ncbi:ligase-associated DNA damage response endonuclease PdeM [Ruegeria lacuscaerulensis]|uniref:ligase-associated DNA damage response endonuclease PdeM n=1 Tax=Ruegeria lacuscaerulensis TaxID=55218 RepID=UPI0014809335|nr:ligase-associated DNA damage response endonuclease PdeM [Ruegeria lacuscaerulensis]
MNDLTFTFAGHTLRALGSGALWWPEQSLLCVSDLHLGKSERLARRSGLTLPPYENRDTLARLSSDIAHTQADTVICLGDSFDDLDSTQGLNEAERLQIAASQAGRRWIWIEGNHDPGPVDLGGAHLAEHSVSGLTFRHIAHPDRKAEISGHYHPKVRLKLRGRSISRPAFLLDKRRLILPAYGTYTGGLRSTQAAVSELMGVDAMAILIGTHPQMVPMPT